jgi:membrane protein insertase Oxa1/YidC/SpoIIIJ
VGSYLCIRDSPTTGLVTAVAATLPAGLLIYWATTGLWTVGQQAWLLR